MLLDRIILLALLKRHGPSRCIGVDAKPHFATTIFVCTVILTVLKKFSIDFLHELKVFLTGRTALSLRKKVAVFPEVQRHIAVGTG